MANWLRTLDISEEWTKAKNLELGIQGLCETISNKLGLIKPFEDEYLSEIHEELLYLFEDMSLLKYVSFEHFNCVMNLLYDWGDLRTPEGNVCWIKTT